MTRLEFAVKGFKERVTEKDCPISHGIKISVDIDTEINKDNNVLGCRGITCIECWNQEYKEGE